LKKIWKRVAALGMVLAMVCAMFAVQASALTSKKKYKNYVVIGDSIAAGYGLNTWGDNPDNGINEITLHHGEIVEGSYVQIVSDAIGAKNTYNLARESYTAPCFLRILDPEYDKELAQPENYYERFLSECAYVVPEFWGGYSDLQNNKSNMVSYIKKADVITINLGNNDTFSTSLMGAYYRTLYYMYGMAAQPFLTALKGDLQTADSLEDIINMVGGYEFMLSELEERTALYEQNYDRLIKRIRELNPDCDIYYVGMYNVFKNVEPQNGTIVSALSESGVELADELRDYVTNRSAYKNEITYVDVSDTEVWSSWPMYTPVYWMQFLVHVHPSYNGHAYMASQIVKTMNGQEVSMPAFTKVNGSWGVYTEKGTRRNYTGMAKRSNGKCYYVKKGVYQNGYTGIVRYNGKRYYVKKGVWQSSYSGTVKTSKRSYTIKNGYVV